jgi:threonine dehydrogenase-like Zn-dependent dehydrogenase
VAVSLVVLGGGNRGMAYARHALALGARVAALAEPRPERRQAFREARLDRYAARGVKEGHDPA